MRGPSGVENIGSLLHVVKLGASAAQFDSGTASPGASATGPVLDRFPGSAYTTSAPFPQFALSGKVAFPFALTMGSGRSFGLAFELKHSSASNTGFSSHATKAYTRSLVGSTATFNGDDVATLDVNLKEAKRFLKLNWHKSFNSTVTGVLVTLGAPVLIVGGALENPPSTY